jgi:hypothetical protein
MKVKSYGFKDVYAVKEGSIRLKRNNKRAI